MQSKKRTIIGFVVLLLIWILSLIFLPSSTARAEAPAFDASILSLKDATIYYAGMYRVDPNVAMAVLRCESQYGTLVDGDGGNAKGPWQYWDDTWKRHYKEFNEETGVTLVRGVPNDDTQLAMWAFSKGKATEWTTYVAIQRGGTYKFYSSKLKRHFVVNCSV